MNLRILERKKQLQPACELWERYIPERARYSFHSESIREAESWQVEARAALATKVGLPQFQAVDLEPQKIERIDKGDYTREKITLRTTEHSLMPVYLLLPKAKEKPLPVVIALHGHGYGVKDIVGLWEDGKERGTPQGYHKDFAVALCQAGFAVAAPEISCFGERQTDFSHLAKPVSGSAPSTCTHTAMLAFHLGISVIGLRVFDGMRLLDYLEGRQDLDINRVGAMGISGGGMHTFFSTCLDQRIKACVVSGYYSTFRDSILAMSHCACNYVPGLGAFGEMHDLVGLISPRPMLVEAGNYDPIFPIQAVRESVEKARSVYRVFGVENKIATDYFEGRHQISGQRAYRFLQKELDMRE